MKTNKQNRFLLSALASIGFAAPSAFSATYYWDSVAGAGLGSATGTWTVPTANLWNLDSTGLSDAEASITTTTTDSINFGNGATGLGAGTITVSGTVDSGDMTFASGSGAIVLAGGTINLGASTITADNATNTISSILSGTSLTKVGTGSLTLSGINTYTGLTNINSGTVKIGNVAALGAQTGTTDGTIIASGATLDLGGIGSGVSNQSGSVGVERLTASGAGVGGNGAILSSTPIPTNFIGVRHLTLADDTTLGFANRWDVGSNNIALPSSLVGGGFALNFLGTAAAAQASLNNLGDTDLGDINVNFGSDPAVNILFLQFSTALGRPANTVTIGGGSTLQIFTNNTNAIFDKKFALNNGILTVARTGGATLSGTISLTTATNTINATTATIASGVISGTGSLIKSGTNTLTLSGANTYTGTTSIGAGTLSINSILNVNGGDSAVGAPTTAADGTIGIGGTTNAGTLTFTGTGNTTTDRVINLAGTSGGATLTQSGASGLLKFTSDLTATGNGGKTLTLQGSTAGTGEISGAIVNNGTVTAKTTAAAFIAAATTITLSDVTGITTGSRITGTGLSGITLITAINTGTGVVTISPAASGAGASGQTMTVTAITSVTKAGTGAWTLSGTNTYTGITSLNAGELRLGSAGAIPGGLGASGGTGGLTFNGGTLGLGGGDFTRSYNATQGTIGAFSTPANAGAGWAAYGADRVVNVGGADAAQQWFNGKPITVGSTTSTHKVRISNPFNFTPSMRPLVALDGAADVDGELSGVVSCSTPLSPGAGLAKSGAGTVALTGSSTFAGMIQITQGTVVVNRVTNSLVPGPLGGGTYGPTLAGGTLRYAPVANSPGGALAAGHSTNRNFTLTASSTIDASGTGALNFTNTGILSPDVTSPAGTTTAASAVINNLASTADLAVGMTVNMPGVPAGRTIASIGTASQITLNVGTSVTAGTNIVSIGTPTARTLTLTGTNTGANTLAGILQDSSAAGAGVLSLTKAGVGNWTLSGASTFTGATTVNDGTLTFAGSGGVNNSSGITVNAGAKLLQASSLPMSPTVTLTQGTLTGSGTVNTVNVGAGTGGIISNNNGAAGASLTIGTLTFGGAATVNTFSNSPAAPIATTNLATNAAGSVTINPSSPVWTDGATYDLISYSVGPVGGAGFGQFVLGTVTGLSARQVASPLGNSGGAITMTITGDTPYWKGDGDDTWNTSSVNNWSLISNNNPVLFLANDNVVFNDNATGAGPIIVDINPANVSVISATFNNAAKDYVLSSTGGFGISSGFLAISGAGKVTINNANTYAGGTSVNAGILQLGNANAIGSGPLTLNGGNLDSSVANLVNAGNNAQLWNSDFAFIGTESLNLGTGPVTLSGNRIVTVSAKNLTVGGSISGFAADLTKLGAGTLTLAGGSTFTGTLAINAGTVALSPATAGAVTLSNAISGANQLNVNPFAADNSDLTLGGDLSGFTGTVNVATSGGFNSKLATTGASSSFGAGTIVNIASGATWFNTANQTGITVNISGTGNSANLGALSLDSGILDSTSSVVLKAAGSIGGSGSATINAPISEDGGSFSLTKQGVGTIFLGGANTWSGLTTVSAGVLVLQNPSALGTTAGATNVASGASVQLDNLTVTGESITVAGPGETSFGALKGRSGTSVWAGPVTVDADLTRIGAAPGAILELPGVIDDGANDYIVRFRPESATATVRVTGANTYTGATQVFGGLVEASILNNVGTASSNFGAPVNAVNGRIILGFGAASNNGTLSYIGAGEITDRNVQIGDNVTPTPLASDTGASALENNGATGPLVFSAPNFNTPTDALTGTTPARTLTLGGTNTAANTISGVIQNNQIAGVGSAAVGVTKTGLGTWSLAGANTYTGNTTANGGTLQIDGTYPVTGTGTTSQLLVGSGATTNGTVVIGASAGTVTFGGNGFANAAQVGVSGGTGALILNGGTVNLAGTTGTTAASLNIGVQVATAAGTGTVTVNAGTLNVGQRILMAANNASSVGTLTIAGGMVNVGSNGTLGYTGNNPGLIQFGNGTGTLNLDSGGTLKLFGFKSSGSAATNINFNGGTLVALGSPALFMGNNGASDAPPTLVGTYTTRVKVGGANIDTNSFNITIPTNLVEDPGSPGGGLTKQGGGVLTLTGANTYTGPTAVSNGVLALVGGSQTSTITVNNGASLGFTLGSTTSSTGTVTFDAGSTVTITGTPSLPSYTLMTTTASFSGIPPVLATPIAGYVLEVETFNTLKLVQTGFGAWAVLNGAALNIDGDHDGDGVTNGVEYFLGGPAGNTTGFTPLPALSITPGLSITWPKGPGYVGDYDTHFVVETSSTLGGVWTPETLGGGNITNTAFDVKYTFPGPLSGKKFARLRVTGP